MGIHDMKTMQCVKYVLGILVVMAVLSITGCSKGSNMLQFETLDAQFALLDKVYPEWFKTPYEAKHEAKAQEVVCNWFQYKGAAAFQTSDADESKEKFKANLMDFVMDTTISSVYYLGERAFEDLYAFYDGVPGKREEIEEKCREYSPEIGKYLKADISSFREIAQYEGLMDSRGKMIPSKKRIVHLLHRHLWNETVSEQFPIMRIEPPEERMAFFRWQIEQSQMPYERKMMKLDLFEQLEPMEYDFNFARAVLNYNEESYVDACAALHVGLEQTDPKDTFHTKRYQSALEQILRDHSGFCY